MRPQNVIVSGILIQGRGVARATQNTDDRAQYVRPWPLEKIDITDSDSVSLFRSILHNNILHNNRRQGY